MFTLFTCSEECLKMLQFSFRTVFSLSDPSAPERSCHSGGLVMITAHLWGWEAECKQLRQWRRSQSTFPVCISLLTQFWGILLLPCGSLCPRGTSCVSMTTTRPPAWALYRCRARALGQPVIPPGAVLQQSSKEHTFKECMYGGEKHLRDKSHTG